MTRPYEEYRYLFVPRPETAVHPEQLNYFAQNGYAGQIKKNGTASSVYVNNGSDQFITRTRHFDKITNDGELHALWKPTDQSKEGFRLLTGTGWYVFACELLHSKVANGTRDTLYIWDIMVDNGEYLTGETFEERQERLSALFFNHVTDETYSHFVVTPKLWIARPIITNDMKAVFDELRARGNPEDEGLVMKKMKADLKPCGIHDANKGWQVKSRIPTKNYSF